MILFADGDCHDMSPELQREILTEFLALDADIVFHGAKSSEIDPSRIIGFAGTFLFLMEMHTFAEDTNDREYWTNVFKLRHKEKGTFSSRIACLDMVAQGGADA